jgi:hypothetical protein
MKLKISKIVLKKRYCNDEYYRTNLMKRTKQNIHPMSFAGYYVE